MLERVGTLLFHIALSVFVFLAACVVSFGSPQLQQWFVERQDRFWTLKKKMFELEQLRDARAKELYRKCATQYPSSPYAAQAKGKL